MYSWQGFISAREPRTPKGPLRSCSSSPSNSGSGSPCQSSLSDSSFPPSSPSYSHSDPPSSREVSPFHSTSFNPHASTHSRYDTSGPKPHAPIHLRLAPCPLSEADAIILVTTPLAPSAPSTTNMGGARALMLMGSAMARLKVQGGVQRAERKGLRMHPYKIINPLTSSSKRASIHNSPQGHGPAP